MKLRYALAATFALTPLSTEAATVALNGLDLAATEATIDGEFGYRINLSALRFRSVSSVFLVDDAAFSLTGNANTGFDVDAIGIGTSVLDAVGATDFFFGAGGTTPGTQLQGAQPGNAGIDESVATLDTFDGALNPQSGFLSMGNGGILAAEYGRPLTIESGDFLFIREMGNDERLAKVIINGELIPVPLPAAGGLFLAGLAAFGLARRRT